MVGEKKPRSDKDTLSAAGQSRPEPIPDPTTGIGWLIVIIVFGGVLLMAWREGYFQRIQEWLPAIDEEPSVAAPSVPVSPGEDPTLRDEASSYVEELTKNPPQEIQADEMSHFVTSDQKIVLPQGLKYQEMTIGEIAEKLGVTPDEPITIITSDRQLSYRAVKELLAQAEAEGPDTTFEILLEDGRLVRYTPEQLRHEYQGQEDDTVSVMTLHARETVTSVQQLQSAHPSETRVRVVQKDGEQGEDTVTTVSEILRGLEEGSDGDNIYHVHTVQSDDNHGLWGIIHDGLIENFAEGIALKRGEQVKKYRITIPRLADEMVDDHTSSYLGRKIYEKASGSHRYNYNKERMGSDPDTIYPDQELVITTFTAKELIDIYEHFVRASREQDSSPQDPIN